MDAAKQQAQARSFGQVAGRYERGRPEYPGAALDWLLPPGAQQIADIGAGTGKLTRVLVARGLDVTAVEPDDLMRAELVRQVPRARALAGTGEAVPLADASMDAALFAQSWHWVDPVAASREMARVLAPGGVLGLLWNIRDESADWIRALTQIMRQAGDSSDSTSSQLPAVEAPFGPLDSHDVAWSHRLTPEGVVEMVASRSGVILMPDAERAALLAEVRDLVARHPDLAGRTEIDVPYVTYCYRTLR